MCCSDESDADATVMTYWGEMRQDAGRPYGIIITMTGRTAHDDIVPYLGRVQEFFEGLSTPPAHVYCVLERCVRIRWQVKALVYMEVARHRNAEADLISWMRHAFGVPNGYRITARFHAMDIPFGEQRSVI